MMDLIDRQAAIDALVNSVSEIGLHDNSEVARYGATFRQHEIIDIIEGLPSAQPEIVRCRECKRWNTVIDRNKAEYGLCQNRSQLEATKADFYCADAERRTDE